MDAIERLWRDRTLEWPHKAAFAWLWAKAGGRPGHLAVTRAVLGEAFGHSADSAGRWLRALAERQLIAIVRHDRRGGIELYVFNPLPALDPPPDPRDPQRRLEFSESGERKAESGSREATSALGFPLSALASAPREISSEGEESDCILRGERRTGAGQSRTGAEQPCGVAPEASDERVERRTGAEHACGSAVEHASAVSVGRGERRTGAEHPCVLSPRGAGKPEMSLREMARRAWTAEDERHLLSACASAGTRAGAPAPQPQETPTLSAAPLPPPPPLKRSATSATNDGARSTGIAAEPMPEPAARQAALEARILRAVPELDAPAPAPVRRDRRKLLRAAASLVASGRAAERDLDEILVAVQTLREAGTLRSPGGFFRRKVARLAARRAIDVRAPPTRKAES